MTKGKSTRMSAGSKVSLVALAVGVLALVAGVVVPGLILQKLHQGIVDHVTLKQDGSDAYYSWLNNTDESKDPTSFFSVRFWNTTNAADVVAHGAEPEVEELPVLTWRRMRVYFNVSFTEDKKAVTYNERLYYVFDQEHSENTTALENMHITGVWPTFLTLLRKAGGTTQHAVAAVAGKILGGLLSKLYPIGGAAQWGRLAGVPDLGVAAGTSVATNPLYLAIVKSQSAMFEEVVADAAAAEFYPEFAAYTRLGNHSSFFHGLTLPDDVSAQLLETGPCPLLTATYNGSVPALAGLPCSAVLMELVQQNVSQPLAVELFPMGPAANATSATAGLRRLAVASYLLDTGTAYLERVVMRGNVASLDSALWATRTPEQWLFDVEDPLLMLLKLGQPAAPNMFNSAFFRSEQTDDEAYGTDPRPTTTLTGVGAPNRALWYTAWENTTVLPERPNHDPAEGGDTHFWCNTDLPVSGHDDTQFPISEMGWFSWSTGVREGVDYPVWVPQLFRAAKFRFLEETEARGITVRRLHLADSEFEPSVAFSEVYGGVLNMTCPQGGPPAILTEPRYYRVSDAMPASYRVRGVPPPVPELHDTFLDVDPVSGTTLRGFKRLQINMWVEEGTAGIGNGTKLVPSLWIEQREELTAKNARKYKDTVTFYLGLRSTLLYALLIGGSVLFLAGAAGLVVSRRKERRAQVIAAGGAADDEALLRRPDADSTVYI